MKVEPESVSIDSKVNSPTRPRSAASSWSVGLDVTLPSGLDDAQAGELVAAAHGVCPYSNATRGNIDVAITVNGEPV